MNRVKVRNLVARSPLLRKGGAHGGKKREVWFKANLQDVVQTWKDERMEQQQPSTHDSTYNCADGSGIDFSTWRSRLLAIALAFGKLYAQRLAFAGASVMVSILVASDLFFDSTTNSYI